METHSFLKVRGIDVEFPHEHPYPAQLASIAATVRALQEETNALIESPTGTGKTLALLAASLAYQDHLKGRIIESHFDNIPERPQGIEGIVRDPLPSDKVGVREGQGLPPVIWYGTRSHMQISQVVRELQKISYKPQMAILASRKYLCLWDAARKSGDLDQNCAEAYKHNSCPFSIHAGVPDEFRPGGLRDKFAVEDLLSYGRRFRVCPYFLSYKLLRVADIVICPHNYIVEPIVRYEATVDLRGSFVILDEAHNIEALCRDGVTVAFTKRSLQECLIISKKILKDKEQNPKWHSISNTIPLLKRIADWMDGIVTQLRKMKKEEFVFPSNESIFKEWGVTIETFEDLQSDFKTMIDGGYEEPIIPLQISSVIEHLWVLFGLCFRNNKKNINNFKLMVILKGNPGDEQFLGLEMLPSDPFALITREARSVILASGTLTPFDSMTSELGSEFNVTLSTRHVIDLSQVLITTISYSSNRCLMRSSKAHIDRTPIIYTELGKMILNLTNVIPQGMILFVPSYNIMDHLILEWKQTGLFEKLGKPVFVDEKSAQSQIVDQYKKSVFDGKGGLLISVCKGRASEGIDFTDDQARAVVVFGVPYPLVTDPSVCLKEQFNNEHPHLTNGNEWNTINAYRTVAQAVGRCIRHIKDYGSIILIDDRFERHVQYFPKWMQPSFQHFRTIDPVISMLPSFYEKMRERFPDPITLKHGHSLTMCCSECSYQCFTIDSVEDDKIHNLSFPFTGEIGALLIRSGNRFTNNLIRGSLEFCKSSKLGYCSLQCTCGSLIGYMIMAASKKNWKYIDTIWLNVNKMLADIGYCRIPILSSSNKSKKISLIANRTGQFKLSFD